ncbi:MAG: RdgB/HAM1 family non-canonical purine NTP pyrophosphatase [Aquiluna sp.]|nr:RdgB/HAM1 family non-canonical purine NTP pyrophosphatase [Aquiluna sp.]
MELVFATGNRHKLEEAELILGSRIPELRLVPHDGSDPVESGTSFLENALIKARAAFQATGKPAFADDSGISVEVMGGAPGIFSAIWSGTRSDQVNRDLLLSQLVDIPLEHRQASFVCTIALVAAEGETSFTGVWSGSIGLKATGQGGFGYDPVFIPEGFEASAAELEPEVKSSFSHRALAMQQLADFLKSR